MIVVKIMGGLGNQMFQYALGRHLSIKYNSTLWLDLSWFDYNKDLQFPREFKLDCLATKFNPVDHKKITWKIRFTDRFKSINPFKLKNILEPDFATFNESLLEAGDDILLEGFFPSYKYFESIRDVLITDFKPVVQMDEKNRAILQKINNTNSVSIHFRRGDYELTEHHGMLDKLYYYNAIKMLSDKSGDLQLFIFSDEPEWVIENMQFVHPFEVISFNKDKQNFFDMELMKHCKHNIIANSSFSWWPAWLNANEDKIVIAPKKWLNVDSNAMDFPPKWIVL